MVRIGRYGSGGSNRRVKDRSRPKISIGGVGRARSLCPPGGPILKVDGWSKKFQ
jgi:hypothetical protein